MISATEVAAQRQSGILDACLVVRRNDGSVHVRETSDVTSTQGAWYGAATGLLAGVVLAFPLAGAAVGAGLGIFAARRHDIGITNDFEKAVADRLDPGRRLPSRSSRPTSPRTSSRPHRNKEPGQGA